VLDTTLKLGGLSSAGSEDGTVGVWNAEAGRAHHRLVGHSRAVRSLAISPGGGLLASGGDDLAIRVSPRAAFGPFLLFFSRRFFAQSEVTLMSARLRLTAWAPSGVERCHGADRVLL
jgi:hypothetical protein